MQEKTQTLTLNASMADLCSADSQYCNNRDFVLKAVSSWGWALKYASSTLRCDKDLVLSAVRRSGYALMYACDELRADLDVVLTAVRDSGQALAFVNVSFRKERYIVAEAIENDPFAIDFAHPTLKNDKAFIIKYVQFLKKRYDTLAEAKSAQQERLELQKTMRVDTEFYSIETNLVSHYWK